MSYRPFDLSPPEAPALQTAGLVLIEGGRVLFEVRPADARVYASMLDLPGGHLETGEAPEQALVREAREELAIEVGAVRLLAVLDDIDSTSSARYRHFIYLVTEYRGRVDALEGQTLVWVPLDEAQQDCSSAGDGESLPVNPLARVVLRQGVREAWI